MPVFGSLGGSGGGNRNDLEPGVYTAYLGRIVALGTRESEYQGEKKTKKELWWQFIIPSERITIDGEDLPRAFSMFISQATGELSNMWKYCQAWSGGKLTYDNFLKMDADSLLGRWGNITIALNQNGKPKLASIAPIMPGQEHGETETECNSFWFEEYRGGPLPDWIPSGIAKMTMASPEYAAMNQVEAQAKEDAADIAAAGLDEDCPW